MYIYIYIYIYTHYIIYIYIYIYIATPPSQMLYFVLHLSCSEQAQLRA